jgi:hypothetical protein
MNSTERITVVVMNNIVTHQSLPYVIPLFANTTLYVVTGFYFLISKIIISFEAWGGVVVKELRY